ncbi:hypothetical protein GUITHDRAFT_132660 [Guillardia theta CCMP2712]|uniref:Uncharacterized protein n=1 Tax=Guillardia theta (strain CCMP2712) TaxID=905079 RepID=L1JZA9_GUITC|nr:hypothetical protein GUITHDRAFT_132660 [Guillardia theta CCMP2712]EKX53545.1 hypothetical protein GUITHDRAFT_132660 [Guillardia theta CCMP2712]|eukprot:XP_005840525.1 hypothetical protein GUITHDRAFT_132660 [Guillardia theta CCMP2712]
MPLVRLAWPHLPWLRKMLWVTMLLSACDWFSWSGSSTLTGLEPSPKFTCLIPQRQGTAETCRQRYSLVEFPWRLSRLRGGQNADVAQKQGRKLLKKFRPRHPMNKLAKEMESNRKYFSQEKLERLKGRTPRRRRKSPWQAGGAPKGGRLEVRKMTKEGNHVLNWGIATRAKEAEQGVRKRVRLINKMKEENLAMKQNGTSAEEIKEHSRLLLKVEHELIKYKDLVYGTNVWKNMTAHTVPYSLRNRDSYNRRDDLEFDKNLYLTRKIVFDPIKLLQLGGVKSVVYLGLIGGGRHVLRKPKGTNPFGNRGTMKGAGPRKANKKLSMGGCKMLVGVSLSCPRLRWKMVMEQLVQLGKLFQDNETVVETVLEALEHFSHCRNEEASEKKIELLKNGGIKFLVKSLETFPTNIAVKRKACDWAVAMVIGPPGRWRDFARQAIRKAKVAGAVENGLLKCTEDKKTKTCLQSLLELRSRLYGRRIAKKSFYRTVHLQKKLKEMGANASVVLDNMERWQQKDEKKSKNGDRRQRQKQFTASK